MSHDQDIEIADILKEGQDLSLATVRPDGFPQANVVSYASDGLRIYFGCDGASQKARNIDADPRVSIAVTLPYHDWAQIRGVSLAGRAERVTDEAELARVGVIFMEKFPEIAQFVQVGVEPPAMFRITPQVVSILDYRKGFGHTELVEIGAAAVSRLAAE